MWEEFRNKTNHLSEKQKENLYKEFYEEEINVSKLMDKYNITNIETIDFYKCLPLRETLVKCKYCESNLYELPNLGILLYEVSKYICLECNHIEYNYHSKKCDCDNCLKEREKVKKEKIEREKRTEIEKNYKRDRWVYPEMISIEDALLLSSFLLIFMGEDLQDTIPYDDVKVKITPNKHWDIKIIEKLFNNRYLVVSPNSKIEAFTIENFPSIFYYSRVKYYFAIKNQVN